MSIWFIEIIIMLQPLKWLAAGVMGRRRAPPTPNPNAKPNASASLLSSRASRALGLLLLAYLLTMDILLVVHLRRRGPFQPFASANTTDKVATVSPQSYRNVIIYSQDAQSKFLINTSSYFSETYLKCFKLDIFNLNYNQFFKVTININFFNSVINNFTEFKFISKCFYRVKDNKLLPSQRYTDL